MIEEFEYKGIWWLPEKPQEQFLGTLRFTCNEGAILNLIGSFKEITTAYHKALAPEIILGISSDGKNIALHEGFETKCELDFSGVPTSSLCINRVFIGAYFQKPEDIKFKSLSVHYLYLDEWCNISGFDIRYPSDEKEVVIRYKLPEPIQASINDYKIFLDFEATSSIPFTVQKEVSVKQRTYIRIESLEEKSFHEYLSIMYHIQNFLSIGIGEIVYPLEVKGVTEANKKISGAYYSPVKIYYRVPDILQIPKTLLPSDMLFAFKDISDRFESFLKSWFKKADLLRPICALYIGTLRNSHMYLEHQFLSLIQAIEAFHRRVYKGEYLSAKEYELVYNTLVKAIPDWVRDDFKDSLKEKLKYGYEFSLRKRLKEIFDKHHEIIKKFIKNKGDFIEKVCNTRNYYTHYDDHLREYAASGLDLHHLTQKLKLLLEICLLTELGFNSTEIKGLFSRNRKYQRETI